MYIVMIRGYLLAEYNPRNGRNSFPTRNGTLQFLIRVDLSKAEKLSTVKFGLVPLAGFSLLEHFKTVLPIRSRIQTPTAPAIV